MGLQALDNWHRDFNTLYQDLTNCTSSYTYGSGRKFQIPSTSELCSLNTLEERVLGLFRQGKEAVIQAFKEHKLHFEAISSKEPREISDIIRAFGELSNITTSSTTLIEFDNFASILTRLDHDSDDQFNVSDSSLLLRIVLWVYRFFSNLFKPSHQKFGARLKKPLIEAYKTQISPVIQKYLGNFTIRINAYIQEIQSQLQALVNTTAYSLTQEEAKTFLCNFNDFQIAADELQYFPRVDTLQNGQVSTAGTLERLEIEIRTLIPRVHALKEEHRVLTSILKELDLDDENCSVICGVKFTAEEIKFLQDNQDDFFDRLQRLDKNGYTPLEYVFNTPPHCSRDELKRSYDALMDKYSLNDSQGIHYPIRICVKLSMITQRLVHLLLLHYQRSS